MFGNDVLSPSIGFTLPFIVSLCFLIINVNSWNISIQSRTFFVILIGIIALFLGELITRTFFINKHKKLSKTVSKESFSQVLEPKKIATNLIIIYMLVILAWYFHHVYTTAMLFQKTDITLLSAYRNAEKAINPILKLGITSSLAISYFYLLAFLDNYINLGIKKIKYLIPVLLFFIMSILSSGRMDVLYLIISGFAISYILYKKKYGWRNTLNLKVVRIGVIFFLSFFVVFYFLGIFTGKSNIDSFFNIISHYGGSSIAALDSFLVNFDYDIANFGSETLHGVTNFFRIFGVEITLTGDRILEFVHLGTMPHRTNIYTAFRRLLNDYGYLGMILIQFFTGIFYSVIYLKNKYNMYKNEKFGILFYVFLYRFLVLEVIDERIILNVFAITTIIQIAIILFLLKFVAKYKKAIANK
jgi:oligosaccharide repeat unit polymerase